MVGFPLCHMDHLRRQCVVVTEAYLLDGNCVILVDDWYSPKFEQLLDCVARAQVLRSHSQVVLSKEHLCTGLHSHQPPRQLSGIGGSRILAGVAPAAVATHGTTCCRWAHHGSLIRTTTIQVVGFNSFHDDRKAPHGFVTCRRPMQKI